MAVFQCKDIFIRYTVRYRAHAVMLPVYQLIISLSKKGFGQALNFWREICMKIPNNDNDIMMYQIVWLCSSKIYLTCWLTWFCILKCVYCNEISFYISCLFWNNFFLNRKSKRQSDQRLKSWMKKVQKMELRRASHWALTRTLTKFLLMLKYNFRQWSNWKKYLYFSLSYPIAQI